MLIESLIFTLIICTIIYFILSKSNSTLIDILKLISEDKISTYRITAWLLPIILIITITFELSKLVIHTKNKEK